MLFYFNLNKFVSLNIHVIVLLIILLLLLLLLLLFILLIVKLKDHSIK